VLVAVSRDGEDAEESDEECRVERFGREECGCKEEADERQGGDVVVRVESAADEQRREEGHRDEYEEFATEVVAEGEEGEDPPAQQQDCHSRKAYVQVRIENVARSRITEVEEDETIEEVHERGVVGEPSDKRDEDKHGTDGGEGKSGERLGAHGAKEPEEQNAEEGGSGDGNGIVGSDEETRGEASSDDEGEEAEVAHVVEVGTEKSKAEIECRHGEVESPLLALSALLNEGGEEEEGEEHDEE